MTNHEPTQIDSPAWLASGSLLDAQQVALLLGISAKTIHKLLWKRKPVCAQVHACERRFSRQQVKQCIEV
jgi:hypothetical protein